MESIFVVSHHSIRTGYGWRKKANGITMASVQCEESAGMMISTPSVSDSR